MNNNDITPFQKFTVKVLKEQCKSRGLKLSGRKSDLLQRLITHDSCSNKKSSVKINEPKKKRILINDPIKITKKLVSDKTFRTIEKNISSLQNTPVI